VVQVAHIRFLPASPRPCSSPSNAWQYVQQNRPFVVLLVCRCHLDSDLDIAGLENLIHAAGMHHKYSFLWVQGATAQRFAMVQTYGVQEGRPALVIDNIPIGQHVEKYLFPGRVERPHTATAKDLFGFLSDFFLGPTPLKLLARSKPRPEKPFDLDNDRGHVVELVGDTFEEVVLHSPYTVLLMLYSPSCPGCQTAAPVLDKVAESLAWTARDVIVAKIDRTANDVPIVLRFQSYPAVFLYKAGMKVYDTSTDSGELAHNRGLRGSRGFRAPIDYYGPTENPRSGNSCNAPLNAQDLEAWVHKHTNGGGNLLASGQPVAQQSKPEDQAATPSQADEPQREAQSTQQAGAAM
jgi:thiol-disulfide isomerase/thioredoxin